MQRENRFDPLPMPIEQIRLPNTKENPSNARDDQRPYYDGAGPRPNKRPALLNCKHQQNRRHNKKNVADEVDLGYRCPAIVSTLSLFGPQRVDSYDRQGAEGNARYEVNHLSTLTGEETE